MDMIHLENPVILSHNSLYNACRVPPSRAQEKTVTCMSIRLLRS